MTLQLEDIQGNILVGYRLKFVAHLFADVSAENLAEIRAFLRDVPVTPATLWTTRPDHTVNVALDYSALVRLNGDADGKISAAFPAFAAGMKARARLLRDDPELDTWANRHLWVSVHADDEEQLKSAVSRVQSLGLRFEPPLLGAAIVKDGHWFEHFGFRDDIANPVVEGVEDFHEKAGKDLNLAGNGKRDADGSWIPLKAGEFVLGYANESNETHPGSDLMPLFRNGTFAVFRDMKQDVQRFSEYTAEQEKQLEIDVAALIIGRQKNGAPLVAPDGPPNDFDFENDKQGLKCPLGAHVRRANHRSPKPNDGGRHRLIRRGRPYGTPWAPNGGEPDATSRGLYFVGLNASIEDQFEFIQRKWINDRASTDGDVDLVVGVTEDRMFVVDGQEPPLTLVDVPSFVSFRGGEYYFMPGIAALKGLGEAR